MAKLSLKEFSAAVGGDGHEVRQPISEVRKVNCALITRARAQLVAQAAQMARADDEQPMSKSEQRAQRLNNRRVVADNLAEYAALQAAKGHTVASGKKGLMAMWQAGKINLVINGVVQEPPQAKAENVDHQGDKGYNNRRRRKALDLDN